MSFKYYIRVFLAILMSLSGVTCYMNLYLTLAEVQRILGKSLISFNIVFQFFLAELGSSYYVLGLL